MYSETDILAKAWMVIEVVQLVLSPRKVDKIFLVGSYASGKADEWSDLDFVVQLEPLNLTDELSLVQAKTLYPSWEKIEDINKNIDNERVHVIFGTEESTKSLHEKHKNDKKDYSYRELKLGGLNADSLSSRSAS